MANRKEELDAKRLSDPRVDSINEELQLRGMSKQDLLKAIGSKDYSTLCKVLNGINPLSDKMLRRIAEGLNLPKAYFEGERELEKDQEPLTRKGYKLMSDILKRVPELLSRCEKEIDPKMLKGLHDFFFNEPTRPLIATGHGGKYAEAVYAALLYGTYQGLGRAITCYSCNSLSDATIKNSKILLVSKGMANIDINYITKRCIELNPDFTCAPMIKPDENYKMSGEEEKDGKAICKRLEKSCRYTFMFDNLNVEDGFIGVGSVYYYEALFYMAFTGDRDFVRKLDFNPIASENYTYESAHKIASVPSLNKIKHFTILYGSYGEPVAYSVDNTIVEGGMAACMVQDYKNYTHGRFIMDGNFIKNKNYPYTEAALICLVTPREETLYEQLIQSMPKRMPVITIRTDHFTPLATLDLLYKANMFVSELAEKYHRTNPCDPQPNSEVDKRIPKNGVTFKFDFERYGALDNEADKQLLKDINNRKKVKFTSLTELFKARNEILQKEVDRTKQAKENWKSAKPLTFDDFSFRTTHVYDTMKQECWSFNSRTDVRDGVELKLGNMGNDFGVKILGIEFPNSEVPYQLAIFDNSAKSVKIQEEIVNNEEWLCNGLKMKRKFIKSEEGSNDEYYKYRRDTEFEKGKQLWCYEWMKWVVWEKVKQNKGFRDILLSIPKEAIIIEQAQKEKDTQWGAWNEELLAERGIVVKSTEIENGVGKTSKAVRDVTYLVNNVGEWIGENAMGQILTMCKLALYERMELPIDETILNDANINWFGQVLRFTKEADGRVRVRTMTPRQRLIPTLGIMGAICGDMLGSVYEYDKKGQNKNQLRALKIANAKKLKWLKDMSFTDDTALTLAVAKWLMEDKTHSKDTLIDLIKDFGSRLKPKTFSKMFQQWSKSDSREPYASGEDGCAMRVSPIAYYAKDLKQCLELARISAEVTHNGEEGIRGAQAIAAAIFLHLHGKTKDEVKQLISEMFPMYDLNRKVDDIRPTYGRPHNCDNVVPESIICFLEGKDYEDTVRLAISLGGDTDTMGSMSGAIAAAKMEIPHEFAKTACERLPHELKTILGEFYSRYKASFDKDVSFEIPLDEIGTPTTEGEVSEEPIDDEEELLIAESPVSTDDAKVPNEAFEGDIELMPDMEVNGYKLYCCYTPLEAQQVKKTRWCYCNSEGKYNFYTQESGFLFVAAKKGYKEIKNPHKGNDVKLRFKLYDDFATSLFSLTTFINPKTNKADIYSVTFRRNDTSHQYEGQHMNTYHEMMEKTRELLGGFDFGKYCIEKTEEHISKYGVRVKADATKEQETAIPDPQGAKQVADGEIIDKKKITPQEVRKQAEPKKRGRKPKNQSIQSEVETVIETKEAETENEVQETTSVIRVHGIIGAVIGEVIGSRFEFSSPPTREVSRFTTASTFTDDTVLTVAVADALLHNRDFGESIFEWARKYPNAGFGKRFRKLVQGKKDIPTDSIGNGGGMRVSPIGFYAKTLEEVLELAKQSAIPSHNSTEGIKGAASIATATFLAKQQTPKEEIKAYIEKEFGYNLDMSDEEIKEFVSRVRDEEKTEWAENTCPLAIIAFLTTDDYESSIWKSISYGCDTDTVACMCGGIAAAYYGVPQDIINEVVDYLPHEILNIINEFDNTNLQNTRTTPKIYDRWGAVLVYGSGSEQITDDKGHVIDEDGFDARQHFGAKLEVKEGFRKRSYAIPTVGKSLEEIRVGIDRFIEYAETHQEETFMLIEIGCKKAGYTPKQIAPMFERAANLPNVYLPKKFREVLTENK